MNSVIDANGIKTSENTFAEFSKVRQQAEHLKHIMVAYGSRVPPVEGGGVFTEKRLGEYLGQLLDIEGNRKLFLKLSVNGVYGTYKSVLTKDEYNLCIRLLKLYSEEIYGHLKELP